MHPLHGLAQQARWASSDLAHNLEFIPADKLDWKPAPTAKSVLEIVAHLTGFMKIMVGVLHGEPWQPPASAPAANVGEAQELLRTLGQEYAAALEQVAPETLGTPMVLPFGTFPTAQAASMPVVELIHHRGQILYIQTLLGDTEDHFLPTG